jgi:hypothetical protein
VNDKDLEVQITFAVPRAGENPIEFRRAVQERIRDAFAHAHFDGKLDAARAEECYRAIPVEDAPK